jgi:hypothetical protein
MERLQVVDSSYYDILGVKPGLGHLSKPNKPSPSHHGLMGLTYHPLGAVYGTAMESIGH